ncbi:MAG: glucose-1-phosphate adenylyltransferase [Burkholderiales bacterium]
MHDALMPAAAPLLSLAPILGSPVARSAMRADTPALIDRRAPAPRDLVRSTYTVVLAGGRGARLKQLTELRSKPAMPFAGHFSIIDVTLSNCVNSGLRQIGVLTQYKAQSLIRHIAQGWSFLDAGLREFIDVVPAQQKLGQNWYAGTADAVYQNLDMLREAGQKYVLVLAGDHVYKMDYGRMIADHVRRDADVTVACIEVGLEQATSFGVMRVDAEARVVGFEEKPVRPRAIPGRPDTALASMGIYVFSAAFLYRELCRDASDASSSHDFGTDIIPGALSRARVFAHDFSESCVGGVGGRPYWRDVGTLDAYWAANLDLLGPGPDIDLYDSAWPIRGVPQQLSPSRFEAGADGRASELSESIVAGGCVLSGATLRRALLCADVRVGEHCVIEESLVLPGAVIGQRAMVKRAIIDSGCVLPDGIRIGVCAAEDAARFTVTEGGIVLVTPDMLASPRLMSA